MAATNPRIAQIKDLASTLAAKASASTLSTHTSNTSNPHSVTKAQVGLGSCDNTSDADKPVSDATVTALSAKAPLANPTFTGTPAAPTATLGTSTTQVATTAFVAAAVADAEAGLLDFIGNLDCSANPNYPSASKGDAYYVTDAGKVGGASGVSVDVGDVVVAKANNAGGNEATVGTDWFVLEHNLAGALLAANNLSDITNQSTARTNLGLGDSATLDVGTGAGTVCAGDDARLTDDRDPNAHASTHQDGGADSIKLDDLVAADDNTDLDATTGAHGLLPKLGGGTVNFLRADGTWATPAGTGATSGDFVIREVPTGDIDDVNDEFTLAAAIVAGSEQVFLNGVLQQGGGEDYTMSGGDTITFGVAPATGDRLLVNSISA